MRLAKVSYDGQVTIPFEIRRLLGLRSGDKISFSQNEVGEVVIANANAHALAKVQKALAGLAEELGVENEDDVQALIDEIRYGRKRE